MRTLMFTIRPFRSAAMSACCSATNGPLVVKDFGSAVSGTEAVPVSGTAFGGGTFAADDAALASTAAGWESQPAQRNVIAAVVIATEQ
jgi:hypothetical protein